MITIVNYGVGNVRAFLNIYRRLNVDACLGSTAADIDKAERLILPGVGAFDWAMMKLDACGLRDALDDAVLLHKVPVLGVCVGMQMMARSSEEGKLEGLGWIDGRVKRFSAFREGRPVDLPHMGWNDIQPKDGHPLFHRMDSHPSYYFLHSYHFVANDLSHVVAECDYHGLFACAVARGNVLGVQFHPEKSHGFGTALLQNFAEI